MKRRIVRLIICLTALGFLGGCLFSYPARTEKRLDMFARDYAKRMRWMDYSAAASFMVDSAKEDFQERLTSLEDVRVVDSVLEKVDFQSGDKEGYTTIRLEYFRLPSASVQRMRLHQKWVYQEGLRRDKTGWRIETPFPPLP